MTIKGNDFPLHEETCVFRCNRKYTSSAEYEKPRLYAIQNSKENALKMLNQGNLIAR